MDGDHIELVVLRNEVRILERQLHGRGCHRGVDRAIPGTRSRLSKVSLTVVRVTPETRLCWHRELSKRKWRGSRRQRGPGRASLPNGVVELIIRLGRENRSWGCCALGVPRARAHELAAGAAIPTVHLERRILVPKQAYVRMMCG
jgi:hypothetical protein